MKTIEENESSVVDVLSLLTLKLNVLAESLADHFVDASLSYGPKREHWLTKIEACRGEIRRIDLGVKSLLDNAVPLPPN